jgi:hypothetical protein
LSIPLLNQYINIEDIGLMDWHKLYNHFQ